MTTVRNRDTLTDHGNRQAREALLDAAAAALDAVHPRRTVPAAVERDDARLRVGDRTYDLDAVDNVYVIGGGKGSAAVAAELDTLLGDRIDDGVVAEKATRSDRSRSTGAVAVVGAGHPLPDKTSAAVGRRALTLADAAGPNDLVLTPITGGASATLVAPADGLSSADLAETTDTLLSAGLRIEETNAVRKHCSASKGGRLAERIAPAATATLVVVDEVAGEPWGPTVGDRTTYADALDVLTRHGLIDAVPSTVVDHLRRGRDGGEPETPTPDDLATADTHAVVLAGPADAPEAARDHAAESGYTPLILSTTVEGESGAVATCLTAVAEEVATHGRPVAPPCMLISGGETTVTVGDGDGDGGPNQEFALAAAVELADTDNDHGADRPAITTLAFGTDGTDGPTDVAGGLVDATTVTRLSEAGFDVRDRLNRHDTTPALRAVDDAVVTGPTGTNVMDLRLTLVA
jgi:hydroxypyruvate reductase